MGRRGEKKEDNPFGLMRVPIVRLCAADGEVLDAFLLRPGDHLDWKFSRGEIKGKRVVRIVCDG
jgi:hypothetical protein